MRCACRIPADPNVYCAQEAAPGDVLCTSCRQNGHSVGKHLYELDCICGMDDSMCICDMDQPCVRCGERSFHEIHHEVPAQETTRLASCAGYQGRSCMDWLNSTGECPGCGQRI